jgi:hypothetical protein
LLLRRQISRALGLLINGLLTIIPHRDARIGEIIMASARKRLELICFSLYFAVILAGTSMEAIGQILTR